MLEDESGDESESEPLGFDSLSELEELSGLSTDDDLNIAEDSTETLDELIGDSDDDDFELDAESTDLLDDFLDSELSDDELSADTPKAESLDPFDDLLTSGIEDELESEEKAFDKELDAAIGFDNVNDEPENDSDVELTPLTSETSEVEPEQASDISETPQPEVVSDKSLDSQLIQDSADVKPENDEAFNRDDFIDDLFGVAPTTDVLLDDSLETTDEALIDELMTSDDSGLLSATEEPVEPSIENTVEPEQASLSGSNEVSAQESASSVEDDELDIDSLLSENSDFDKPDFEERAQEETDAQEQREDIAASFEDQASSSPLNDISEDDEETVEDWLAEAIDDVESPANVTSDFDFEPKIQGSDQLEDVVESLPEPVRAANMPEIIPNEFGVPQDDDWLIEDEASEPEALAETDVTLEPVAPVVEPKLDVEPQVEATPQTEVAEQAEVLGQEGEEEFSFDDFDLPEFGEEDALADAESTIEPVTPAIDSQPSVESQPTAEPQLDAAPQAETAKPESEEEFSFDDFELPEFGEDDALAEVVSGPDEAQLEQDLAPDTEKFEFDDLDLPEYDEESAKADSVLDDIEQSNAERWRKFKA